MRLALRDLDPIAVAPDPGVHREVRLAQPLAVRVVPEPERHRRHRLRDDELADRADQRAPVRIEGLHVAAQRARLQLPRRRDERASDRRSILGEKLQQDEASALQLFDVAYAGYQPLRDHALKGQKDTAVQLESSLTRLAEAMSWLQALNRRFAAPTHPSPFVAPAPMNTGRGAHSATSS